MLRTASSLPLHRAFDAGLRPDPFPDRAASLLPGPLAVTRTGLAPASDEELTTRRSATQNHSLSSCPAGRPPDLVQIVLQVLLERLDGHPIHAGPLFPLTFIQASHTSCLEMSNGLTDAFNSPIP